MKMNKTVKSHSLSGMTLTELLVVLAILGVLLLLAFPILKPLFSITHAVEAQTNLKHLATLQETYHMRTSRYTDNLSQIGFEQAKLISEENGTAHYQIEIVRVNNTEFLARATSITDFDGDGILNVWEIDKNKIPREVVPD
ncbi:MAG: type IV pilin protein [Bacteroidota bacterium]